MSGRMRLARKYLLLLALAASVRVAAKPLNITTTSLPAGTVGVAYSHDLAATGGQPPYSWSISRGAAYWFGS